MKWVGIAAALLLSVIGVLMIVTGDDTEPGVGGELPPTVTLPDGTVDPAVTAGSGPQPTAPPAAPGSSQPLFTVTAIEGLPIETVPTVPAEQPEWAPEGGLSVLPVDDTGCEPVEAGFGVELRPWGQLLLPYAVGWPTNEPGQPPNCSPETPFGAALTAAHLLWIDAFAPELIPSISNPTPGQQLRLAKHPGPFDVNEIGYVCEPIGWSAASFRTFRIYTQCDGDGAVKVTNITVIRSDNRWLLLYPPTGEHITRDAGAGEAFYPFAGGD